MFPRDKGGIVDPRLIVSSYLRLYPSPFTYWRAIIRGLKVYGTLKLRVVDLSTFPLHIGAPTHSISFPPFPCLCCANVWAPVAHVY